MCLAALAWKRTSCEAHRVRNASLWVASSPTRSERSRSYGSRPAAERRIAAVSRASPGRLGGAGEVEEVGALGVVELERSGQCLQHALGGAAHVSAFQARVVRSAHTGED